MPRITALLLLAAIALPGQERTDITFRSDVALVRVDAQVVDRTGNAITSLRAEDFLLFERGRQRPIKGFSREEMPVDILLLIDVSGSMRSHVQRLANAAGSALQVLRQGDRVGVMVFDRRTHVRMPLNSNQEDMERALEEILNEEGFDGGTDITRAFNDAAVYMMRNGRRDARRAIVIMTDDRTGGRRNVEGVLRDLAEADTVVSALIAPDAMRRLGRGGGLPGGILGGIILGRGRVGRGGPPVTVGGNMQSAGTREIAEQSGGDSMNVDDADALETTFLRIRQRYALHFYLPEDAKAGEERDIDVQLAQAALRRYPDATVRFRRVYLAPGAGGQSDRDRRVLTKSRPSSEAPEDAPDAPVLTPTGGTRTSPPPAPTPSATEPARKGGWRRATPEEMKEKK
ncbi:MAG TPA: hypothetical protein DEH78_25145 [Solibacterales bacterium]|nr:hypothetical protein [Bryobacterales bacterium]